MKRFESLKNEPVNSSFEHLNEHSMLILRGGVASEAGNSGRSSSNNQCSSTAVCCPPPPPPIEAQPA